MSRSTVVALLVAPALASAACSSSGDSAGPGTSPAAATERTGSVSPSGEESGDSAAVRERAVDTAEERRRRAAERRERRWCRTELLPRLEASYRIWWKWTDTGKAWWITTTFDNRTGTVLWGSMSGTADATKVLPDPFGWEQGPRRAGPGHDARLMWGGSSADILEVRPGVSTQYVAPDADIDVHTTVDGTFRVTTFDVGLGSNRAQCSVPVRQEL